MKNSDPWTKLAARAGQAPSPPFTVPYGFSTRVIAQWRSLPQESIQDVFLRFIYRGLAVAAAILIASSVYGYETLSNTHGGETALAGSWVENLLAL